MFSQVQVQLQPGDVVLRGGWLFDSVSDGVRRNSGIVVRNGEFIEVDAHLTGRDLRGTRAIDLADDEYILPGLFDLHAHYAVDLFGEGRVDEFKINPLLFLANGVTSTFPAGEVDPEGMMEARKRIDSGQQIGPRIFNSGPYFGSARPGWKDSEMTPEAIRTEVRTWAALGIKGLKAKGIRPDQLEALIDEGHRHSLTVTGHLDSGFRNSVNPRDAIAMGIDRVEHFMGGDAITPDKAAYSSLEHLDPGSPEVAAIFKTHLAQGVYFDATLSTYGTFSDRRPEELYAYWTDEMDFLTPYARTVVQSQMPRPNNEQFGRLLKAKLKEVKAFYDAGGAGLITLGTDQPSRGEFWSGFMAHRELHALVLAGIPPAAALKIGTVNGARAFNVGTKLGAIERGRWADLFVVRGNPLEDIRHTRNVRMVMKAGEVYDPAVLLASARGRLGPLHAEDAAWWKGNSRFRKAAPR
ncbi:MAG: amidohydrolase family protein [Bryobacterales bacterium]|nr:amidohydrolase family protein [Bryobacterales bacterium]